MPESDLRLYSAARESRKRPTGLEGRGITLRPFRSLTLAAALFITASFSPAVAAQHEHGLGYATGFVLLGAQGSGSNAQVLPFGGAGLTVREGDSVQYSWSANGGSGPAVYFEIHSHTRATVFYNATGSTGSGTWRVPGSDSYGALWRNPNSVAVNVTYSFEGIPAPQDLAYLIVFGIFGILAIGVGVAIRRTLKEGGEVTTPPEEPPVS